MDVLVLGGAGYIGSHMCKLLHKNDFNVIVLDNLSTGFKHAVKYGTFIQGDINDNNILDKVFIEYNIQVVFHFAASSQVQESMANPLKYYQNNVSGTINLLSKMVEYNVNKIIFSSTAAIFGNPEYLPIDEKHPMVPINPYGKSKLMIENILEDVYKAHGISSVSLRYFNAAGADPEGELGENHDPETHLIPIVLETANDKRDSITIFGDDYDTDDGTCVRDYIHITDLCTAHLLSLEYLSTTNGANVFNLGNGNGYSIRDIISTSEKITKKEIKVTQGARRKGDPSKLISNSQKSKQVLQWVPKYSLENIVEHAWNWEVQKGK